MAACRCHCESSGKKELRTRAVVCTLLICLGGPGRRIVSSRPPGLKERSQRERERQKERDSRERERDRDRERDSRDRERQKEREREEERERERRVGERGRKERREESNKFNLLNSHL
jgi:hypothetical protein